MKTEIDKKQYISWEWFIEHYGWIVLATIIAVIIIMSLVGGN